MRVPDVHVFTEKWRFHCLECRRVEEVLYEARHFAHSHTVTWWRDGVPVQPPWIDPICPNCPGLRVKVIPAGAVPPQP